LCFTSHAQPQPALLSDGNTTMCLSGVPALVAEGKAPPAQVADSDNHSETHKVQMSVPPQQQGAKVRKKDQHRSVQVGVR